ncbi:MAG: hypothetical protein HAW67_06030 [Endozoicomonadaceae bacterium]|nr:hypothetical protein [Endozoicomonadaceae bacterium]
MENKTDLTQIAEDLFKVKPNLNEDNDTVLISEENDFNNNIVDDDVAEDSILEQTSLIGSLLNKNNFIHEAEEETESDLTKVNSAVPSDSTSVSESTDVVSFLIQQDNECIKNETVVNAPVDLDDDLHPSAEVINETNNSLQINKDDVPFPKELLETGYKVALASAFRSGILRTQQIERTVINSDDLCLDVHLKNKTCIKDYHESVKVEAPELNDAIDAAIKMAKLKGWNFIKVIGDDKNIEKMREICGEHDIGIRSVPNFSKIVDKLQSGVAKKESSDIPIKDVDKDLESEEADVKAFG